MIDKEQRTTKEPLILQFLEGLNDRKKPLIINEATTIFNFEKYCEVKIYTVKNPTCYTQYLHAIINISNVKRIIDNE